MEMVVVAAGVLVALVAAVGRTIRTDGSRGRGAGAAGRTSRAGHRPDWAEGTVLELPRSTPVSSARMGS